MDWTANLALVPYGNYWRAHRRILQSEFSTREVSWHHPQQTNGVHGLLLKLLELPDKWREHIRQYVLWVLSSR